MFSVNPIAVPMVPNKYSRRGGRWVLGLLAGFLLVLTPWPRGWSQEEKPKRSDTRHGSREQQLRIVVENGRLSVDVQDADFTEVLTQIGQQAGFAVYVGPDVRKTINARFNGVELEQGLRQLLRVTSFSHAIFYAAGPAGTVMIKEIHVLTDKKVGAPASPFASNQERETVRGFREALRGSQQESPLDAGKADSEVTRRIREALQRAKRAQQERAQQETETPPESESTDPFAKAFEDDKQLGNGSLTPAVPHPYPAEK